MNNLKSLLFVVALLPVVAGAQSVNHREAVQHHRIVQGVRHHTLTRHEAAVIRGREAILRARERRARLTHGHLSSAERARLERELNRNSHAIHTQKHDAQHRH